MTMCTCTASANTSSTFGLPQYTQSVSSASGTNGVVGLFDTLAVLLASASGGVISVNSPMIAEKWSETA